MAVGTDLRICSCSVLIAKPLFCRSLKHYVYNFCHLYMVCTNLIWIYKTNGFSNYARHNMRYAPIWLYG